MSKRRKRAAEARIRGQLRRGGPELIPIEDVAILFNKSIKTIRNYKSIGIISPVAQDGNKDLFDRGIILRTIQILKRAKAEGMHLRYIARRVLPEQLGDAHEAQI